MLFKPELCQLILHGLKIQTRRLAQPSDEPFRGLASGRILWVTRLTKAGWRLKWMVDAMYAVQPGRGKKAVGYIILTQIRQERLQEISPADVAAEGFFDVAPVGGGVHIAGPGPDALPACWDSLNRRPGERWADNPLVWALTFEVAK